MSNKKNSELKNRMSALKVGEPFRLPKSGPTFTAPSARASEGQAPQNGVPSFELAQSELAQIDDARNKATPNGAPHNELSHLENASGLGNLAAPANSKQSRTEGPRTEAPRNGVSQSDSATDQNAYNDRSRIEVAQNERTLSVGEVIDRHAQVCRTNATRTAAARAAVAYAIAP